MHNAVRDEGHVSHEPVVVRVPLKGIEGEVYTAFLMRGLGLEKEDLSWIAGVVGTITVIAGSLVSAWAVRRWGLRKAIWPLTVIMNRVLSCQSILQAKSTMARRLQHPAHQGILHHFQALLEGTPFEPVARLHRDFQRAKPVNTGPENLGDQFRII